MSEERLTAQEWDNRERYRTCGYGGHQPHSIIRDGMGQPVHATCECGLYGYEPKINPLHHMAPKGTPA